MTMTRPKVKEICPKTRFKFVPCVGWNKVQTVCLYDNAQAGLNKVLLTIGGTISQQMYFLHSLDLTKNISPGCRLVSFFLKNKRVVRSRGQKWGKIFSDLQLRQKVSKTVFYYHPELASCLDSAVFQEWNNLEMCPDFTMCQLCGLG